MQTFKKATEREVDAAIASLPKPTILMRTTETMGDPANPIREWETYRHNGTVVLELRFGGPDAGCYLPS